MLSPSSTLRRLATLRCPSLSRSLLASSVVIGAALSGCTESGPPAPAGGELATRYASAAQQLIEAARSSDVGYQTLAELCDRFGPRLSGSPQLEAAIDWSAAQMEALGLRNVHKEEVEVPVWIRGTEFAQLLEPGPRVVPILGLGGSVGTASGGVTAPVVVVDSFDALDALDDHEIEGNIVLFNAPFTRYGETVRYRAQGPSAAAKRGAVACLVRSIGPVAHRTPHTGSLHYEDGVRRIPAAAVPVEDALMMQRMQERGDRIVLNLEMEARFAEDARSYNLIGELEGSEMSEEVVVIGGHIDSWDVGQGAQDDGVGCIIALEAARLIQELGLRPRRSIRVVFFTNEENGLRGAKAYRTAHAQEVHQHVAAIEADSGNGIPDGFRLDIRAMALGPAGETASGPTDSSQVIAVKELQQRTLEDQLEALRQRSLAIMEDLARLLEPLGASKMALRGSGADVGPLAEEGVACLGLSQDVSDYFVIHHTPADTFDKISKENMQTNVAAVAILAYVLADMPGRLIEPGW